MNKILFTNNRPMHESQRSYSSSWSCPVPSAYREYEALTLNRARAASPVDVKNGFVKFSKDPENPYDMFQLSPFHANPDTLKVDLERKNGELLWTYHKDTRCWTITNIGNDDVFISTSGCYSNILGIGMGGLDVPSHESVDTEPTLVELTEIRIKCYQWNDTVATDDYDRNTICVLPLYNDFQFSNNIVIQGGHSRDTWQLDFAAFDNWGRPYDKSVVSLSMTLSRFRSHWKKQSFLSTDRYDNQLMAKFAETVTDVFPFRVYAHGQSLRLTADNARVKVGHDRVKWVF